MTARHSTAAILLYTASFALLPAAAAHAQEAERPVSPQVHQEGIAADRRPALNAVTGTEDTPVIEEDKTIGGAVGDGYDIDVMRETPDPDPDPEAAVAPEAVDAPAVPEPAESFRQTIGPNAGGSTGAGRIYAEELKDYTVHLTDAEKFGRIARLIVNLETGQLEKLVVSTGGLLGVGDERYEIPFDQVAAINTGTKEIRVAISRAQIQSQDQAFGTPTGPD